VIRLLQFAAIILAVLTATTVVAIAMMVRSLRRRLRPVPQISSAAPLRWLVTSSPSARLHRRLRTTARVGAAMTQRIRRGFPDAVGLADVGEALALEADRIDRALVELDAVRGARRRGGVRTVEERLARLEASTERFCLASEEWTDAVAGHARHSLEIDDALLSIEEATRTLRQLNVSPR
jgi:hypothetical protein